MRISDWSSDVCSSDLRIVGQHPETGNEIEANIGRYGPYLRHNGKYAKLAGTREVFDVGMNAAVTMLAEAANRKNGGEGRAKAEPIATLGAHPTSGGEIKAMPGRYGPYLPDPNSVVGGKGGGVRVDLGGGRNIKKK